MLSAAGVTPLQVDVLDRAALLAAVDRQRCDAVISELTSMKKPPTTHNDMAATDRLRIQGTTNLLAAAERVGARRFVTQSMVFGYGYGDFHGRVLTEDDHLHPSVTAGSRSIWPRCAPAEQQVSLRRTWRGSRCGTACSTGPVRPVMRWSTAYAGDGCRPSAMAACSRGSTSTTPPRRPSPRWKRHRRQAYNVADDEPVSFPALMTAMAAAVGAPQPRVLPSWLLAAPLCQGGHNRRPAGRHHQGQAESGWAPRLPTYRDGVKGSPTTTAGSGMTARHRRPIAHEPSTTG